MSVSGSDRPPETRDARRAATRERLRQAGLELFAERGLHGLTTHDIAHHAGLAAGTFYLHFQDKQALFREIALEALDEMRSHLQAATNSSAQLYSSVAPPTTLNATFFDKGMA